MNRTALDAVAAYHGLSSEAIEQALDVTGARPTRPELVRFGARVLRLAGVLSAAAGLVFLVAANWSALTPFARFALVQGVLAAAAAAALARPPPHALGRYALLCAFIATGALLALLGQTYQTGADVYELFASWALVGLAFAAAAQWSVVSAAWLVVANVALALYCGLRPESGPFWLVFSDWGLSLLLVPFAADALFWWASTALERSRWSAYAPRWLGRLALALGAGAGTWAGVAAILDFADQAETFVLVTVLAGLGAIALLALRRRTDVFPLALVAGSIIALATTAIARGGGLDVAGTALMLTTWLVASSTASAAMLTKLVRAWHGPGTGPRT